MSKNKATYLILAMIAAGLAYGHAKIVATVPADGDYVAPPETLVLTFDSEVRLTGVELHTADGDPVDLGTVDEQKARSFVIRVPRPLAAGGYYLVWRSIAADKHFSTGEFFFTVIED